MKAPKKEEAILPEILRSSYVRERPSILLFVHSTSNKEKVFALSIADTLLNTFFPDTKTGGWVPPEATPNHTLPPNATRNRSPNVGFQQETHCLPSLHTCSEAHSLSVIVAGFCSTLVDCLKSIGFIKK